jgi:hypothetical protein
MEPRLPTAAEAATAVGGTAFVLGYIEHRLPVSEAEAELMRRLSASEQRVQALQARVAELEAVELRAAELQRTVEALTAQNLQLQERLRELEIGFRRFVSERVAPEQLALALATETTGTPPAATPDASPSPEPSASSEGGTHVEASSASDLHPAPQPAAPAATSEPAGAPPSSSDPEPKEPKKRHNHGRRRKLTTPRVILEVLPPEVVQEGVEKFERIGHEESSTLGYRRGGPIELVTRRVKFVRGSAPQGAPSCPQTPGGAGATGSPEQAPACSTPSCPIVREHEVAMVPADTAFKTNPFVDGALVRYTPPSTDDDDRGAVLIADVPERPLARSLVDASLLARLLVHKLDYHMPFYRQEIEANRQGCPNSRTNMCRWQFEAGGLARRIADAAWQEAIDHRSWFGMDATGIAIQDVDKYRYGHVFVLVAPGDSVLYRYAPTYDGATVEKMFGGYKGVIVADASANHNGLFGPGKAREGGCWSHGRKPFVKAFKAGEAKSAFALQIIQRLFRIEKKIALLPPDERLTIRRRDSAPLVEDLFEWAERELPSAHEDSFLRKGLVYLHNQREALHEFLRNGEIPIHNTASERAARHVVKGRSNWLAHGSDDHAERACALTSLIVSCQVHGLDPELYLQEVLTVAPSWPVHRMLELTPKHWVATRQRLIAEGRLKYIDLAAIAGSRLISPARG